MRAASASAWMPASAEASGPGRGGAGAALTKSSATFAAGFALWPVARPATESATTSPRGTKSCRITWPSTRSRADHRTTRTTGRAAPGVASFRKRGYG
jgi:hypothetical protein